MTPSPGQDERAALRPEAFARLEVCVPSATPRLSDDQVLDLAEALYAVVRARRRRPYDWLRAAGPRRRPRPGTDGKVVELWPRRAPEQGARRPR